MSINFSDLTTEIFDTAKDILEDDWDVIKGMIETIINNKKDRMDRYMQRVLDGDYTKEDLIMRLEDEKGITEAELAAINIIKKAETQRIANAVSETVNAAILKALDAAL